MKARAACVACGALKTSPVTACPDCGFEPKSEFEIARALILSRRFVSEDMEIGRGADELEKIAQEIRAGRPYRFDPQEEHSVVEHRRARAQAAPARPGRGRLKWLVLLALMLALLIALLWPR